MRRVMIVAAALVLSACAVQKEWIPTGGSRSDGMVRLSYEYGAFEKPILSGSQAQYMAAQRCGNWGYSGAEPFGGSLRRCSNFDPGFGCNRWMVTVSYQCTGRPDGR